MWKTRTPPPADDRVVARTPQPHPPSTPRAGANESRVSSPSSVRRIPQALVTPPRSAAGPRRFTTPPGTPQASASPPPSARVSGSPGPRRFTPPPVRPLAGTPHPAGRQEPQRQSWLGKVNKKFEEVFGPPVLPPDSGEKDIQFRGESAAHQAPLSRISSTHVGTGEGRQAGDQYHWGTATSKDDQRRADAQLIPQVAKTSRLKELEEEAKHYERIYGKRFQAEYEKDVYLQQLFAELIDLQNKYKEACAREFEKQTHRFEDMGGIEKCPHFFKPDGVDRRDTWNCRFGEKTAGGWEGILIPTSTAVTHYTTHPKLSRASGSSLGEKYDTLADEKKQKLSDKVDDSVKVVMQKIGPREGRDSRAVKNVRKETLHDEKRILRKELEKETGIKFISVMIPIVEDVNGKKPLFQLYKQVESHTSQKGENEELDEYFIKKIERYNNANSTSYDYRDHRLCALPFYSSDLQLVVDPDIVYKFVDERNKKRSRQREERRKQIPTVVYSGQSVLKPHPQSDVDRRLEIVSRLDEEERALEEKIRREAYLEISRILDEKKEKVNKLKEKCKLIHKTIERLKENFSKTRTKKILESIADFKYEYGEATKTVERAERELEEEKRYLEATIEDIVKQRLVDILWEKQEDLKRLNEFMKERQGDTVRPRTPGTPGSRPTRLQSRLTPGRPSPGKKSIYRVFIF